MATSEWMSLVDAATACGVHRNTLGRWVTARRLKSKAGFDASGKPVKLVNLAEVRKLVGSGVKPGRPAKGKR